MGDVRLTPRPPTGRGRRWEARWEGDGRSIPKGEQMDSADMLKPRKGRLAWFPRSVDRNAPREV